MSKNEWYEMVIVPNELFGYRRGQDRATEEKLLARGWTLKSRYESEQ